MSDLPALWVASTDGEKPAYTDDVLRKFFAGLLADVDPSLNIRTPGRLVGLDVKVSGKNVSVSPGIGVVLHQNSTFWVLVPEQETLTVPAAHATYARKDLITLSMGGTGSFGGRLRYITGVPAAIPKDPATTDLVLARVSVPATGSISVTSLGAKVLLRGGNLPVKVTKSKGVSGDITANIGSGIVTIAFKNAKSGTTRALCTVNSKCNGTGIIGNANDQYPVEVVNGLVSFLVTVPSYTPITGALTVPVTG